MFHPALVFFGSLAALSLFLGLFRGGASEPWSEHYSRNLRDQHRD